MLYLCKGCIHVIQSSTAMKYPVNLYLHLKTLLFTSWVQVNIFAFLLNSTFHYAQCWVVLKMLKSALLYIRHHVRNEPWVLKLSLSTHLVCDSMSQVRLSWRLGLLWVNDALHPTWSFYTLQTVRRLWRYQQIWVSAICLFITSHGLYQLHWTA